MPYAMSLNLNSVTLLKCMLTDTYLRPLTGGVYARDRLPTKTYLKPTLVIANTDEADNAGTHWVAMMVGIQTPEYFDSLGDSPCKEFVHFLGKRYTQNTTLRQSPNSSACGYYCLYYVLQRARGVPFETVCTSNMSEEENEKKVVQFVTQLTNM